MSFVPVRTFLACVRVGVHARALINVCVCVRARACVCVCVCVCVQEYVDIRQVGARNEEPSDMGDCHVFRDAPHMLLPVLLSAQWNSAHTHYKERGTWVTLGQQHVGNTVGPSGRVDNTMVQTRV
jgi:hypothetical protein